MLLVTFLCLLFSAAQAQPPGPPGGGPPPAGIRPGPPPYNPTTPPYRPPPPPYPTTPYRPPYPPYPPYTTTPYWPPYPPYTTTTYRPYPPYPGSQVTNRDMQAAISNAASLTFYLSYSGRDASSTYFLRQLTSALQSLQYLYYDQNTLAMLSPAINQLKATTTTASSYCKQQPLSVAAMSNLSGNLVYWSNNGRNPTPQQVQNLFNTASQFLQQYC